MALLIDQIQSSDFYQLSSQHAPELAIVGWLLGTGILLNQIFGIAVKSRASNFMKLIRHNQRKMST